jgi:hypothetical protein
MQEQREMAENRKYLIKCKEKLWRILRKMESEVEINLDDKQLIETSTGHV